jgi:hypothetical protein
MYSLFRVGVLLVGGVISAAALRAAPPAPGMPATVDYAPLEKVVQGNQPLVYTYDLTIIGPYTVDGPNSPVTVTLAKTVLEAPTGFAGAAMGYLQIPPTVTFTKPNERVTFAVTVNVPLVGGTAGDYKWLIKPVSWPAELNVQTDTGSTINAKVTLPLINPTVKPTVSITSPAQDAEFLYNPATGPVTFPIRLSASVATGGGVIDRLEASVGEMLVSPMTFSPVKLGTLDATGVGTSPPLLPGSYTITALASNIAGTGYAMPVTVRVILDTTPVSDFCADLEWLPPISLNNIVEGGSVVPIKFTLSCDRQNKKFVEDRTLVIAIDELNAFGTSISHAIYSYGGAAGFSIDGNHYQLNFATPRGVHHYRIEVFHPLTPSGTQLQSLGPKELTSR